jgi:hypothetical protein
MFTGNAQVQPTKVNYWHEQLANYMLAHPTDTNAEIAKHFKVSKGYICILKNSDVFKSYYRQRADKFNDAAFSTVLDDVVGQTVAMTSMALDALNEKLEHSANTMATSELLTIADTGLKRLGYGATKFSGAPVNIQNNINNITQVNRGDLDAARRKLAEAHGVDVTQQASLPAPVPSVPSQSQALVPVERGE